MDLDDVAERLYGLAPEDFTTARDAAAKDTPDKELRTAVKALRRPSVSAWVLNLLARQQPELLEQVLELGPALAEAQRDGQGDVLRELGAQRRQLVGAVTGTAVGLTGREVTAQVRAEVEQTLEAALADPASADAVRSGRLVRSLQHAGFGGVDLAGAVAVEPTGRARRQPSAGTAAARRTAPDTAALEAAAHDAAAALDDAVRACEDAVRRRDAAERVRAEAAEAAQRAAAELQALEEQLAAARDRERTARQAREAAVREAGRADAEAERRRAAVGAAQDAAEQARAELDRARRG